MPLEVALLTSREPTLDEVRGLGEMVEPPLVVSDSVRPGVITVTELDDTLVATIGRARRVETDTDLVRAYGPDATLPGGGFLSEAIVPFEYRRGLALVFAVEDLLEGRAIVRGLDS